MISHELPSNANVLSTEECSAGTLLTVSIPAADTPSRKKVVEYMLKSAWPNGGVEVVSTHSVH